MSDAKLEPVAEIKIRVYRAATDTWEEAGTAPGYLTRLWQFVKSSAQGNKDEEPRGEQRDD